MYVNKIFYFKNKAKQSKTKQNKTKQNKTKQNKKVDYLMFPSVWT